METYDSGKYLAASVNLRLTYLVAEGVSNRVLEIRQPRTSANPVARFSQPPSGFHWCSQEWR